MTRITDGPRKISPRVRKEKSLHSEPPSSALRAPSLLVAWAAHVLPEWSSPCCSGRSLFTYIPFDPADPNRSSPVIPSAASPKPACPLSLHTCVRCPSVAGSAPWFTSGSGRSLRPPPGAGKFSLSGAPAPAGPAEKSRPRRASASQSFLPPAGTRAASA